MNKRANLKKTFGLTIEVGLICMLFALSLSAHPGVYDVTAYGAVPDDSGDDTAAFQIALNAAGRQGSTVYAPTGSYTFSGHITVPAGVTLTGTLEGPFWGSKGTYLNATEGHGDETAAPFISLEPGAGIKGCAISYPNQNPGASTPTPYPWTIRTLGANCRMENLLIVRPYKAVDMATYPSSHHFINNVFASPLKTGIVIDGSTGGRINNVHFTTFGLNSALTNWRKSNSESFLVYRADDQVFTNCFSLWCKVGFQFMAGTGGNGKSPGPARNVKIAHSGIDVSNICLQVDSCQGLNITESVFKGNLVWIKSTNTHPVKFSQCNFSPIETTQSLVIAEGKGRVSFLDCCFEFWDNGAAFSPALKASCSALAVLGCEFGMNGRSGYFIGSAQKRQIEITSSVENAVVTGNRFRYGQSIVNNAGSKAVITDNVTDNADL